MKNLLCLVSSVAVCLFAACSTVYRPGALNKLLQTHNLSLVDEKATPETKALFYNLKESSKSKVLFGHMEDNKNGYDGWQNVPGRSDVYEVTGSYPAIYGFDFGGIASLKSREDINTEAKITHNRVLEAYQRKGIITFSWHYNNPVSNGSFYWDKSPVKAVAEILPHGTCNQVFKQSLIKIARFAASLTYHGKLVPVIFRPFHEFDGNWFWWGASHCTADEYKALYGYTVSYLRDSLHVKNFLYSWSPDCNFKSQEKYIERYPGNNYVDIAGMDNYYDLRPAAEPGVAAEKLKIISDFALQNHKVAALTETGLENLPEPQWYTQVLLKALKDSKSQIAYAMVWSNRPKSFWTPYKGHPAEQDFIIFKNDPSIVFSDRLIDFYKVRKSSVSATAGN